MNPEPYLVVNNSSVRFINGNENNKSYIKMSIDWYDVLKPKELLLHKI
jgi:hypothetical protein